MRKVITNVVGIDRSSPTQRQWLDLEKKAVVQATSEDPKFPIESALTGTEETGWRAATPGDQIICIVFDRPRSLHRIRLEFSERDVERTQEFTLRWAPPGGSSKEIVRQQWNFSPQGSTVEVEDYQVRIKNVLVLELALKPDVTRQTAFASLAALRLA